MKVVIISVVILIAILDILLILACGLLETEEDRRRSDQEQIEWLRKRKRGD